MSVRRIGLNRPERPWGRLIGSTLLTHQLADGPLAAWPMQETSGTIAVDVVNGHNNAYTSTTLAQAPLIHGSGYSAAFGSNGYMGQSPVQPSWLDVSEISVECVFRSTSDPTGKYLISRMDSFYGIKWWVGWDGQGRFVANFAKIATTSSACALDITNSHHVVATYAYPGTVRLYLDGALVAESIANTSALGYTSGYYYPFHFGHGYSGQNFYWGGRMSHAAYYGRALSADDIMRHAKAAGLA